MKPSVKEQEQNRKARARLRMLQHCNQISQNVCQTCRCFGMSRFQFYIWLRPFVKKGI